MVRVISGESVDLPEDEIRKAFETNLEVLEEGLQYVDSEVNIGTGRIDTLAIDEKYRPVFIEYKRKGEFSKDALIQLMDYLSWFIRDETHLSHLEKIIKNKKPDLEKMNREIRLICVVSDVEDRVKNACYVIGNPVQIISYTSIKDEKGEIVLIPKLELDNAERVEVTEEVSEDELLKENPTLSSLYQDVKKYILTLGKVETYIVGNSVRFKSRKKFANLWFTKKWISLELFVGKGAVQSERFTYWRKGDSDAGYVHLTPKEGLDEEIKNWIKIAFDKAS